MTSTMEFEHMGCSSPEVEKDAHFKGCMYSMYVTACYKIKQQTLIITKQVVF